MVYRIGLLVVVFVSLAAPGEAQQVVRFETTEGNFDMVLNPTNNAALDDYAQNLLNYVENNAYLGSWINRAAKNSDGQGNSTPFVLQMGGFFSHTFKPSPTINSIGVVNQTFADVPGHPAADLGMTNSVGTVSLALPSTTVNGQSKTERDAGSTSFFINAADNSFLDSDFTVFAAVPDMTTINKINAMQVIDRTQDPTFAAQAGGLGLSEVPVDADGNQVFIKRAFLVTDTLTIAKDIAGVQSIVGQSLAPASNPLSASDLGALGASGGDGGSAPLGLSSTSVPEPTTVGLLIFGACGLGFTSRRRR